MLRISGMDAHRWSNVSDARKSYDAGALTSSPGPLEAFFEVAARCNLRCQMCAINYDARYQPRSGRSPFLEPEIFARFRPMFPTLVRAYLFGLGEPTLNRNLVPYVRELSQNGAEVWFNTNATLIDEAKAEDLALAGADRITVSIDGATAGTYEQIRRGAKFEAVLRGIRALVAANRRHGRPRVDLSFVAMASNVAEMPAMIDLCAELGATGVHVEPLYQQAASNELMEHYAAENLDVLGSARVVDAFASAAERAKRRGVFFQSRLAGEKREFDYVRRAAAVKVDWTCSEPWASIWVTSQGEVRTCCTNEVSFGSVREQSIDEIWNGAPFRRFRAQHVNGEIASGCANCIRNGRLRHSPFFRTLKPVTYEPLFRELPPASSEDAVSIDSPEPRSTVTDPLTIRGSLKHPANRGAYELMIDHTPVANLNDRVHLEGSEFTLATSVPYVTEGAHVIWARRRGEPQGWGYREVFLWRAS